MNLDWSEYAEAKAKELEDKLAHIEQLAAEVNDYLFDKCPADEAMSVLAQAMAMKSVSFWQDHLKEHHMESLRTSPNFSSLQERLHETIDNYIGMELNRQILKS